ncbi:hypothetical protein KRR38_30275 [Novosphingobium sp. G106]|uniref:hypothetical protein n=1 Tax=Novosphingobium sp. G106 TaxID=2849500 RepID=UPI001C2CD5F4|nr:hypothetical protein [Novosphingobium sp. G106]MBV1691842.1 hypothetical protein [Novosphingobium sp. G106]
MMMLSIIAQALGLVFGSLMAAALFSWFCWTVLKFVRHPELGVPFGLALLLLLEREELAASEFLRMTLAVAALVAVVLWPLGLEWRHDHPRSHS